MKKVRFRLNGEMRSVHVEPHETLLEVLRDKCGVKSPKCGCDRGDCGACSVLLNGHGVRSCLVFAVEVEDHEVVTVEGLSGETLTAIQRKFIEYNSFQCGFCAPGVIISTAELLERHENPTIEQIKEALSGNLCRCTGYTPIIDAIMDRKKGGCHE
ncbi:MAG: (2Fe-2S)-binding protein [Oligoflexales bacterium]|nr:(2Fe-2S)-binding protein [Oligoflexales bacterium]